MQHDKILEHFTKDVWLLEKIFWKSSDVLYDFEFERAKIRLTQVYKKTDVDLVFPSRLDEDKLRWVLDILFRVPQFWLQWEEEEQKKKFLWIF